MKPGSRNQHLLLKVADLIRNFIHFKENDLS
ncbi:hypothetical protein T4C_10353 [Trichinella pseudospiralis]|uniref:Uncharacterized protein n=1 Tax=Trichinella pseudospiralis TaxID=6337 RepID=A0A0V1GAS5_TRIPS|nr:hypothetical protein T4C_10353 [Trichinella pseudospiralis]